MSPKPGPILNKARVFLRIAVFATVALLATLAAFENTQGVQLRLLGYESMELSAFWWILIAFGVGILVGRLVRFGPRNRAP